MVFRFSNIFFFNIFRSKCSIFNWKASNAKCCYNCNLVIWFTSNPFRLSSVCARIFFCCCCATIAATRTTITKKKLMKILEANCVASKCRKLCYISIAIKGHRVIIHFMCVDFTVFMLCESSNEYVKRTVDWFWWQRRGATSVLAQWYNCRKSYIDFCIEKYRKSKTLRCQRLRHEKKIFFFSFSCLSSFFIFPFWPETCFVDFPKYVKSISGLKMRHTHTSTSIHFVRYFKVFIFNWKISACRIHSIQRYACVVQIQTRKYKSLFNAIFLLSSYVRRVG